MVAYTIRNKKIENPKLSRIVKLKVLKKVGTKKLTLKDVVAKITAPKSTNSI
jgi:hypothetical protein